MKKDTCHAHARAYSANIDTQTQTSTAGSRKHGRSGWYAGVAVRTPTTHGMPPTHLSAQPRLLHPALKELQHGLVYKETQKHTHDMQMLLTHLVSPQADRANRMLQPCRQTT
jgi:hypothetical protein